nr:RHS repeat-associated core domain-containing protein [Micromonospora sp. DSM 115978]
MIMVLSSMMVVPPAAAQPAQSQRLQAPSNEFDSHGGEIAKAPPRKQAAPPDMDLPDVVWPAAGTARVTVPAPAGEPPTVQAPNLPVSVAAASEAADRSAADAAAPAGSELTVRVLDRQAVPDQWRDGVLLRLTASAGNPGGRVRLSVNYSDFRLAYGGDWSSRLRLWKVPPCALTTPDQERCGATPLPSKNDTAALTVSAETSVATGATRNAGPLAGETSASTGHLVALAAASSGPSGDFGATSMLPSSTWSVSGSTGGFTWSYPMRVPPGTGGPVPEISLAYSSASVDGRSEVTNNQPSWIGEGFEYAPGYIERRYVPCAEDMEGSANNAEETGDLCWRSNNAVANFNGGGSELIWDSGSVWRQRTDDGSKIDRLTGADNGDDDGEYWRITTTDGTRYYFGVNRPAGHTGTTDSTWTVPVYGNHTDEPCNETTFGASACNQAWRWNLDYVIDTRGNSMSYWYDREWNNYAAEVTSSKVKRYVRGGTLRLIDYGTWDRGTTDRSIHPTGQILFDTGDRCRENCGIKDAEYWPDVPWDQECADGSSSCQQKHSPTFWSTKRLNKVTTRIWDTTKTTPAWQAVDSWQLEHSFPPGGDGSTYRGLWLKSIRHTGEVAPGVVGDPEGETDPITLPPVTFEPVSLPNRVLTLTDTSSNWQRMSDIYLETGGHIQVTYSLPDCTSSSLPSAPHTNTRRCYPVIGPDPTNPDGPEITTYWHKYLVNQVSQTDLQLGDDRHSPTVNTYYSYIGSPAWHYADDDGLIRPKRKTWNQFRGYPTVEVRVGESAADQTLTRTTYLRGMHGDRAAPSGGTRTVTVPASAGSETVYDEDAFAGMVREEVVYNGTTSRPVSRTVNVPWQSPPTASRTINTDRVDARYTGTQVTYDSTALGEDGAGGWRTVRSSSTFDDSNGSLLETQDDGDIMVTGDEKCVSHTYNRNVDKNLTHLVKRTTTTALACGSEPTVADHLIGDVRNTYDGASSPDTAPIFGGITRIEQFADWTPSGGTTWQVVGESTLDRFGRIISETDIKGNVTTIAYTPENGGPVTRQVKRLPSPYNWTNTTDISPYWGTPLKMTDPNGRISEATYDALGRTTGVWEVGWSRATHPNHPSVRYSYHYAPDRDAYPYTLTQRLHAGANYLSIYQILDAFMRPRQVQTHAVGGGRVVTDTRYDSAGRAVSNYAAHAEPGDPSGIFWWEAAWSVPAVTRTVYDQASRATAQIFLAGENGESLVERWRTTNRYTGDTVSVTPPDGGVATTTVIDARGRTVQLRQHNTPAGVDGAYQTTQYTYNNRNQLVLATDPAGNEWSYEYDARGRQVETKDPDRGVTTMAYNSHNELVSTTNALGETLVNTYDQLGRPIGRYEGSVESANLRAKWVYDRTYGMVPVRGQLTETIRYEGGHEYKWQLAGYNSRYQPTAINFVIPDVEIGLAGTWKMIYGYSDYDGSVTRVQYPPAGGLANEAVTTTYHSDSGLPKGLETSADLGDTYVTSQSYTAYGEPEILTLERDGGTFTQEISSYELDTRRVARQQIKSEITDSTVADTRYSYDAAGNIESIIDEPQVGQADRQCFEYDTLRRLREAWTPKAGVGCGTAASLANLGGAAPYWTEWTIDAIGNRTEERSHGIAGDTVRTYAVPSSGQNAVRPHAVTSVTTNAPGQAQTVQSYSYDATGNMVGRPGPDQDAQTLDWDIEGRPVEVTEDSETVTNVYDVDGNRLIRRDATGATLYLPGMEVRRNGNGSGATVTATRHYSFGGRVVASRVAGIYGVSWILGDHQGTERVSVNASSQQVVVRRQTPYGAPRGTQPVWPTPKGFVGGAIEPTGLTHIGARQYDPALGRFISVDPIMDLADPQQWHAYAYANNNPITFSDPTGLVVTGDNEGQWTAYPETDSSGKKTGNRIRDDRRNKPDWTEYWPDGKKAPPRMDSFVVWDYCDSEINYKCHLSDLTPEQVQQSVDRYFCIYYDDCAATDARAKARTRAFYEFMSWVPGLGIPYSIALAKEAWSQGDYVGAGMEAAGAFPIARTGKVFKYADEAADTLKGSDEAVDGYSGVSKYEDITDPKSRFANRLTDVGHEEFADNLVARGWTRSTSKDGQTLIFQKDGAKYVLREKAKTYGGWTAEFTRAGDKKVTLKIRLGG